MRLYLDNNALSSGGLSVVKTSHDRPAYILYQRRNFSSGGYDLNALDGRPLGSIRQKTFGFFPRYDLYIASHNVASLKKMFGVWHEFIFVSRLNWMITGNLHQNHYQVFHGVKIIFSVKAVAPTILEIEIGQQRDIPAALLIAAILDRFRRVGLADPQKRFLYGLDFPG